MADVYERYAIVRYTNHSRAQHVYYYTSKEKRDRAYNTVLNTYKTKKGCCIDYANDNEFKVYTPFDSRYLMSDFVSDEYDVYETFTKTIADEIFIDVMNIYTGPDED